MTNEEKVVSLTPEGVLREAYCASNLERARVFLEVYDRLVERERPSVGDNVKKGVMEAFEAGNVELASLLLDFVVQPEWSPSGAKEER